MVSPSPTGHRGDQPPGEPDGIDYQGDVPPSREDPTPGRANGDTTGEVRSDTPEVRSDTTGEVRSDPTDEGRRDTTGEGRRDTTGEGRRAHDGRGTAGHARRAAAGHDRRAAARHARRAAAGHHRRAAPGHHGRAPHRHARRPAARLAPLLLPLACRSALRRPRYPAPHLPLRAEQPRAAPDRWRPPRPRADLRGQPVHAGDRSAPRVRLAHLLRSADPLGPAPALAAPARAGPDPARHQGRHQHRAGWQRRRLRARLPAAHGGRRAGCRRRLRAGHRRHRFGRRAQPHPVGWGCSSRSRYGASTGST